VVITHGVRRIADAEPDRFLAKTPGRSEIPPSSCRAIAGISRHRRAAKIRELRRKAEEALGGRFDSREFHDTVLSNGEAPLPVLEELVDQYIQNKN